MTGSNRSDVEIRPFRIEIPQAALDDLRDRLARTRWPDELPGVGWSRGVPVNYLKGLADYWANSYDCRKAEARLNEFPQFTTEIDGQDIHFVHVRSANADATPLLLLHDWPGSYMQFIDVIGPLSQDFHLVIPSMPGIGFAIPLSGPGWNIGKTADAYTELMPRLCYDRYDVQGSGGGAYIGPEIGRLAPERVIGVHVNVLVTFPSGNPADFADLIEDEQERLARLQHFRDDMLTNVSIYWFTGTAGSSVNLYYEMAHDPSGWGPQASRHRPTGVAVALTTDVAIRRFAERDHNITHWTEFERGGAFLAMEQPDLLVGDVRAFFSKLR